VLLYTSGCMTMTTDMVIQPEVYRSTM
jgi:hypothetical protein